MTNEDTIRALEAVKALTGPPISFDRAVSPHLSYAMAKIHSATDRGPAQSWRRKGAAMTLAGIKRGPLGADEKAEIARLALTLKKPMPGPIARRLDRHPATVKWHMLSHGLLEYAPRYGARPYRRAGGSMVNPYTPAQDRRLLRLRRGGAGFPEIAAILTREFGVKRTAHSVQVRCIMLAASADAPAAEAPA